MNVLGLLVLSSVVFAQVHDANLQFVPPMSLVGTAGETEVQPRTDDAATVTTEAIILILLLLILIILTWFMVSLSCAFCCDKQSMFTVNSDEHLSPKARACMFLCPIVRCCNK
ncbi:unnamed protein product [Echinostoma caproni]|uniref:Membrane protein ORF59 n=1 Tax=Echinostoma caproni TaxID=27848 RepID=A0A183AUQ9_9TREM|nr:unnamed protein product [Echinostoma caproni]